jgi:ribosomal protein S18 acetylase RimI-like enzyme
MNASDWTIRDAEARDFMALCPLFGQLWPGKAIDRAELEKAFIRGVESETDGLFCAVKDSKIIGFCAYAIVNNLWQEGRIAYIYALVVDESLRGRGIGTGLITETLDRARSQGLKRVELDSGFPREKAHAFYQKLGFEKRAYLFSYVL